MECASEGARESEQISNLLQYLYIVRKAASVFLGYADNALVFCGMERVSAILSIAIHTAAFYTVTVAVDAIQVRAIRHTVCAISLQSPVIVHHDKKR